MFDNPSDLQQVTIPELIKFSLVTTFKMETYSKSHFSLSNGSNN